MNRKVLLICYYFPPLGLAGVGRPLNLFKRLPRFGWNCHVLTVKPVTYWAYEPDLLDGLDTSRVYRSGSWDPQRLMYLAGVRRLKAAARVTTAKVAERFFPDSKKGWVRPAVRLGRTLAENYRYDALLSTSPPISAHLVGRKLAREFSIPWLADFRDFWTSWRVEEAYDSDRYIRRGKELLATITREAAAVTGVNEEITAYLGIGRAIPNGFDSDRMEDWRVMPDRERYTIGILGNLHDVRVLEPLGQVVSLVREQLRALFERVHLVQVGNVDETWLRQELTKYDLQDRCDILGYQPRSRTVKSLAVSSLFYLGMPAELDKSIIPSRMFDLLASGRPIMVYAPSDSALARLIDKTGNGVCFDDSSVNRAGEYVCRHLTQFDTGEQTFEPLPAYASPYSSDAMAEKFARVLDEMQ